MKAYDDLEPYLVSAVEHNPALLAFSKFGAYLPLKYQVHLVRDKRFDFAGAMDFLSTVHTSSIHTLPDS